MSNANLFALALTGALALGAQGAASAEWKPTRPVEFAGSAGPGGGTDEKPVGLVHLCVAGADRRISRAPVLPGSRGQVRARAVSQAMHLVRELLQD